MLVLVGLYRLHELVEVLKSLLLLVVAVQFVQAAVCQEILQKVAYAHAVCGKHPCCVEQLYELDYRLFSICPCRREGAQSLE